MIRIIGKGDAMQVTIQTAETQLAELIEAAKAGEEVILANGDIPVAKIVPYKTPGFKIGILEGQLGEGPDFFEPMSEEDLRLWEGGD